jgi:M-phase inducer tyrosine phosphatase
MKVSISTNELADLIANKENRILILDARYDYEFEGGHIRNAINIQSFERFLSLFQCQSNSFDYVVAHCEFSTIRGPSLIEHIFLYDKFLNKENLLFPKIYLLEGGYSLFYSEFSSFCEKEYRKEKEFPSIDYRYFQLLILQEMKIQIKTSTREYKYI